MNNLPVQNVANFKNEIYLFLRQADGSQEVRVDKSFYPYYWEPESSGEGISYDGVKVRKFVCAEPKQIKERCSESAYEADIVYTDRYILDCVDTFVKSKTRIVFLDIEIATNELPRPKETQTADSPVSSIVIYDNYAKKYKTFFLNDYPSEYEMLEDFCSTIQKIKPDILTAWNIEFDWFYLYYRIPDLCSKLSPIQKAHWRKGGEYPAGISVVDLLGLYWKMTRGQKDSYALDEVAQEELGYESWGEQDFTDIATAKEKCRQDVEKMVKLEEKHKIFDYYDEVRLVSMCPWEALPAERKEYTWTSNNSKVIDMLALKEAKRLNVVLPSKRQDAEVELEMEGAYREVFQKGLHKDLSKVDISGAYPQAILDFCLSPENFVDAPGPNILKIDVYSRETSEYKATYYVKQNPNAILPSLVRKLLAIKNEMKKQLKSLPKESEEYKKLEAAYDARKNLVNSAFGVIALRFFRLYSSKVGDVITFLIRDLLKYSHDELIRQGKKIIYTDTDSFFYETREDYSQQLNQWAREWGKTKYNNDNINIIFDWEGYFSSIFIPSLCRYRGRLETAKGQKIETKGIQAKRRDAGIWVKSFQNTLFNKILDGEQKLYVLCWIAAEIDNMKKAPLLEISVPTKINKPKESYKKREIWMEAIENTQKLVPEFNPQIGDKFFWLYAKACRTLALSKKYQTHIKVEDINWPAMIERNVINLLVPTFIGLGWNEDLLKLAETFGICIGSQERKKLLESFPNKEEPSIILKVEELAKFYSAREMKKRLYGDK